MTLESRPGGAASPEAGPPGDPRTRMASLPRNPHRVLVDHRRAHRRQPAPATRRQIENHRTTRIGG